MSIQWFAYSLNRERHPLTPGQRSATGMKEDQAPEVASLICRALRERDDESSLKEVATGSPGSPPSSRPTHTTSATYRAAHPQPRWPLDLGAADRVRPDRVRRPAEGSAVAI